MHAIKQAVLFGMIRFLGAMIEVTRFTSGNKGRGTTIARMSKNDQRKKVKERECLDAVLYCRTIRGSFAREIKQLLLQNRDSLISDTERPDLILPCEDSVIGIEHCQADAFFRVKSKKAQSMIGKQFSQAAESVELYRDKELLDSDIKNGKLPRLIYDMVEERSKTEDSFNYDTFISNFRKVCLGHNSKCEDYRKEMQDIAGSKQTLLGCLVEIPHSMLVTYEIITKNEHKKKLHRGLPISKDMLATIREMTGFDFVILCLRSYGEVEGTEKTICYFFCPASIGEGIREQSLHEVERFSVVPRGDLSFSNIEYQEDDQGNGSVTAKAIISFNKR